MSCIAAIGTTEEQLWAAAACETQLPRSTPLATARKQRRLFDMSVSKNPAKRAAAAGNPMTPEDALWELAEDEEFLVRAWVTRNPNATELLLVYMANNDRDPAIRAHARFRLAMLHGF